MVLEKGIIGHALAEHPSVDGWRRPSSLYKNSACVLPLLVPLAFGFEAKTKADVYNGFPMCYNAVVLAEHPSFRGWQRPSSFRRDIFCGEISLRTILFSPAIEFLTNDSCCPASPASPLDIFLNRFSCCWDRFVLHLPLFLYLFISSSKDSISHFWVLREWKYHEEKAKNWRGKGKKFHFLPMPILRCR